MFSMIQELAELFEATGGKPANEIWAHPATMDYILASVDPIMADHTLKIMGALKPMIDIRIRPGVAYLDRDGEHTHNQREMRTYHTWAELEK
jgi:hypothetical protein